MKGGARVWLYVLSTPLATAFVPCTHDALHLLASVLLFTIALLLLLLLTTLHLLRCALLLYHSG
jgi:hypothetical protein